MQQNIGKIDRTLRIIGGIAIIGAGVYFQSWWGVIGVIPLATASIGWCPAYAPFGLSTRGKDGTRGEASTAR
jgi:hypothetical protein